MLCFILTYIISTSTGLARGMRYLSESNGYITLGLLFAVLILGATPFTYVINMLKMCIRDSHRVAGNQAGVGFGAFSGELDLGASSAVPIRSILNSIDTVSYTHLPGPKRCLWPPPPGRGS